MTPWKNYRIGAKPSRRLGSYAINTGGMKIIEHPGHFEVTSDTIVRQFFFDDNASRRAISGKPPRKRALQEAMTFAGPGHTIMGPLRPAASADKYGVPRAEE
jgi:hypothetical protein